MKPYLLFLGIGAAGMLLGIYMPGARWGPCGPGNAMAGIQLLVLLISLVMLSATTLALAVHCVILLLRRGSSRDS